MMNRFDIKKAVPHLIAIAIFLLVAVIFCKPALDPDLVMKQSDVAGWQGMSHQSYVYKEKNGHVPLWVTSMFSGMPGYQIALEGSWSPLGIFDHAFQLWLPQPLNFFFLACISFYFMCICMRIRPFIAIIGALGFAYSSFSPIIISAGHNTQMLALGYAPAVIGSVYLIFKRNYFAGFTLTALFTALQIAQGHQQISYYLFLILLFMSVAFLIQSIKQGTFLHVAKSAGLIIIAGVLGVAVNAIILLTTLDYSKESKRGGQLVMDSNANKKDKVEGGKTKGLSKDYAFQWSYGKAETWSLMFPGVQGYGFYYTERDGEQHLFPSLDENAHVAKYMSESLNLPPDAVSQLTFDMSRSLYWGGQQFGTNGPIYLGAIMCFLFILGLFYLDNQHKWWILACSVFAILLSWGNHLPGFNYFMFDNFPLYNKFRVPTMTLVIPQLLFPLMAVLTLNSIAHNTDGSSWKRFRNGLIATAGIFILIISFYSTTDYSRENKQRTARFKQLIESNDPALESKMNALNAELPADKDNQVYEYAIQIGSQIKNPDPQKVAREMVSALRKDRASALLSDIIRSFAFVLGAVLLIALYLKKKMQVLVMIIGIGLLSVIDQLGFGKQYLNEKSFDSKDKYEASEFPLTEADKMILEDQDPNFRVFNTAGMDESRTSYYHKSIGGYHPAKLGIYDDLMAYQLNGNPNISVVNMLNAKYIIQQQDKGPVAFKNPGALGNVWFVNHVQFVDGPVAEMKALNQFNPKDTLIADKQYQSLVTGYRAADSSSSIKMTSFDNDAISYESNTAANHIAVFSEVYYKDWKAYIDGNPAPYFKANYVLRAMLIPSGKHKIEFKFEPSVYYQGKNISNISVWVLMLVLVSWVIFALRKKEK